MKAFKFFIGFVLIFAFTQCKKTKDTPAAIKSAIVEFDKDNTCSSAKVDEYKFQSQTVYVFDPGMCGADMTSRVADADNKTLGYLGGIAGITKINGEDFSKAKHKKTVWKK